MANEIPLNPNVQTNLKTLPNLVSNVQSQFPDLIKNVTNNFIVRPSGNTIGVSGFVFDVIAREEIMVESDITDHFIEDNSSIQDHIALRPERFILSGFQGELRDIFSNAFLSILTTVQSFGTVGGLAPEFSAQAAQVYSQISSVASKVGNVFNQAQNIYDIFLGRSTTANRQQQAFQHLYNLWLARQLCQIETPYGILNDMAIEHIRAQQDESTRLVSDFEVTFKRIRKATTTNSSVTGQSLNSVTGRAAQILKDTAVNNGSTAGLKAPGNLLTQSFSSLASI